MMGDLHDERFLSMTSYEVTYEENGETKSELIEAKSPVEASRRFMIQNQDRQVVILCVVRQ